jgi:hypothetical protein
VTFERELLSVLDRADIRTSRAIGTAAAFDRRVGRITDVIGDFVAGKADAPQQA